MSGSSLLGEAFPDLSFAGKLRPSQSEVVRIAEGQLQDGQRRLHVVAPPGSGKTVTGLYLWSQVIRCPALVLSPNSAIQGQWAARTSMLRGPQGASLEDAISTTTDSAGLLTSLTYQSITLPARASEKMQDRALDLWIQTLLEDGQAESSEEAVVWIDDLRRHNEQYHRDRLAQYVKRLRDDDAIGGAAMQQLHDSCLETLERLRASGVGLLILDECHHLMGHWGRVLSEVSDYLGDPVVLGLTATPPDRDGRREEDVTRYDRFFGDVDYEVPVPAVVKDGFLAPYQDLAFFVRPAPRELEYIAKVDEEYERLLESLVDRDCNHNAHFNEPNASDKVASTGQSLTQWTRHVLTTKRLPVGKAANWEAFVKRDPEFGEAAVAFLLSRQESLPDDVAKSMQKRLSPSLNDRHVVVLLDRFTRHYLRRSPDKEDRRLADRVVDRLRMLGTQITDTGHRPCASPVSRVIGYTSSKTQALHQIMACEMDALGDRIRAVVISDFEKTSAVSSEVAHLLDEEAGGAVAAFRTLLADPRCNELDPVLLTGSSLLVDSDLVEALVGECRQWLRDRNKQVALTYEHRGLFSVVTGGRRDWCPRTYVEMITDQFQLGLTRCLVGTRGLLGEGWDANKINVLVDLSTVTTSMTVNQLRGRSIRLDPNEPRKVANNWDVVCIAPEFKKGLDDYQRFIRKHRTLFGLCDDGAIEKGVGHVHAAFTELEPELLEGSMALFNEDMLRRASHRDRAYQQWKVGEPYQDRAVHAVEFRTKGGAGGGGFPPLSGSHERWTEHSLTLAMGESVLLAMRELGMILSSARPQASDRDGGYVRLFLENATEAESQSFAEAMGQLMGPLVSPRYVIPRSVDLPSQSLLQRWLPEVIVRFLARRGRKVVMLHSVPDVLATKRSVVDVFQKHWNRLVSPGEAVYARNEKGQLLMKEAFEQGQLSDAQVHAKEIFR